MVSKPPRESTYERWIKAEGVPIHTGYGITDVRTVEVGPWERMGGLGAFIQLEGMEGLTGMYVGEIPPGGTLKPERHMYEELIFILSGRGATEVWSGPREKQGSGPDFVEWTEGALFPAPLNTWHRLHNASGTEPARFLVATNAPLVMDIYHNRDFMFGCDFPFTDRFAGESDYFAVGKRAPRDDGYMSWNTNFIPNVPDTDIDPLEKKGAGVQLTPYEMGGNVLVGHLIEWPVGRYHKGHYHSGGAILFIVRSEGYTLMWPQEAGPRPWETGRADQVVNVPWQVGSVFSPPTGWFHQHFNTGPVRARQLAFRYGSHTHVVRFHDAAAKAGVLVSTRDGGSLIEYEDEDPEILRLFQKALAENGVEDQMGPVFGY